MGYQESYVTANNKKDFLRIVKRIQELGHGFYDSYGTYPVEIITFNEYHDYFRKGQQAIYFVGERYLQNELGGRLLGYTDEFYEDMSDEEMDKHIEEELSFHLIKYYTEDIDASGIWEDAGEPLTVKHEGFNFDAEYIPPEDAWLDEESVYFPSRLCLRGCDDVFELIDAFVNDNSEEIEPDEAPWNRTEYVGVWKSLNTGSTIILNQIRYPNEETEDMDIVVNAISEEPYMYLMKELNNNTNLTIYWSQVYGTTSDYCIIYNNDNTDDNYETILKNPSVNSKYSYIKDNKMNAITNEMMGRIVE